jgi:hypothetical protein
MRTRPEDLRVMEPEIFRKMSRRDIARMEFVVKKRQEAIVKKSIKLRFLKERLKILDVNEFGGIEQKEYTQLVEEINKNYMKMLENVDNPLQVYRSDKEMIAEEIKRQDETISSARRIIYPLFGIALFINSLIIIGVYYQNKQGEKAAPNIELRRQIREMHDNLSNPDTQVPLNAILRNN